MKKDKNSIFIQNFAGQLVEVFTGTMQTLTESDSNGNSYSQSQPVVLRGYLINVDDNDNLYLGDTLDGITKCVKMGPGTLVEIVLVKTEFDDILDNMPIDTRSN